MITKNKSVIKLIAIAFTVCSITSCGISQTDKVYIPQQFDKDANTIRAKDEQVKIESEQQEIDNTSNENNTSYDTSANMSEVKINGTDETMNWTVENDTDIIYKGVRYKNLFSNLASIESPYDINTLINFIVKTYDASDSEINTTVDITNDNVSEDETYISLDEELSFSEEYIKLCEKYNDKAVWQLTLESSSTFSTLVGCKSFVLMLNSSGAIEVNMDDFKGKQLEIEESQTEIETQAFETESQTEDENKEQTEVSEQ